MALRKSDGALVGFQDFRNVCRADFEADAGLAQQIASARRGARENQPGGIDARHDARVTEASRGAEKH